MSSLRLLIPFAAITASFGAATVTAQQARPIAIVNARIVPVSSAPIENGTVLIRGGTIEAVGADVDVPPGAKVIDAAGGTVTPGIVSAWSQAGLTRPRAPTQVQQFGRRRGGRRGGSRPVRPSSNAADKAATQVADRIYARQDVFGELLGAGVTTLAVAPNDAGFPGLAARLDPSAKTQDALAIDRELYVVVAPAANTQTKRLLKSDLDKAKQVLEERKKPKPAEQPAEKPAEESKDDAGAGSEAGAGEKKTGETPPAPKDGEGGKPAAEKPEPAKPEAKPEPKKDPNIEVLADLLDGKRRAFLRLSSAADLVHYLSAVEDHRFPSVVVADAPGSNRGRLDEVRDQLAKLHAPVLMRPELATLPYTRTLISPPAELQKAGVEIGFLIGDSARSVRELQFKLIELVRHGFPADAALAAVTRVPAKMLGIDSEVGTIETGKRADLLLFSSDPFDPASKLVRVFHRGAEVQKEGN